MSLRKILSDISGMSLTEVMVGLGLLGGVSIVTMKAMQDQASNESYMKWTAAVNRATLQIQNTINNSQRCNEMLVGVERETTVWPNVTPGKEVGILRIKKGTGYEVLLQADMEYAEGFYIPPDGIRLMTSSSGSSVSELVIVFKTRNRAHWKNNNATIKGTTAANQGTIIKRIPFVSKIETAAGANENKLVSCGPVIADEDIRAKERMCNALGGAAEWDSVAKTCTLKEVSCPPGEVPVRMTSLGNLSCVPVTNEQLRSQLFDFSETSCAPGQGVTLITSPSGKIMAGCTGNATGCPAMTMTWYSTEITGLKNKSQCSANIGAGTDGQAVTITDSTAPTTGTAPYICDNVSKTWKTNGTSTCIDSTVANCSAKTVYWSGATKFCSFMAPAMNHGQAPSTVTDGVLSGGSDGKGTATVECSNGVISIVGTPVCCTKHPLPCDD